MDDDPLILNSAHRHGVSPEDMLHAYDFPVGSYVDESSDPRPLVMLVGPTRAGTTLLEIGVVEHPVFDAICIVHAMRARNDTLRKAGLKS